MLKNVFQNYSLGKYVFTLLLGFLIKLKQIDECKLYRLLKNSFCFTKQIFIELQTKGRIKCMTCIRV